MKVKNQILFFKLFYRSTRIPHRNVMNANCWSAQLALGARCEVILLLRCQRNSFSIIISSAQFICTPFNRENEFDFSSLSKRIVSRTKNLFWKNSHKHRMKCMQMLNSTNFWLQTLCVSFCSIFQIISRYLPLSFNLSVSEVQKWAMLKKWARYKIEQCQKVIKSNLGLHAYHFRAFFKSSHDIVTLV